MQFGHFKYNLYEQRKRCSDIGHSVPSTCISMNGEFFQGLDLRRLTREKYCNAFECIAICIQMVYQKSHLILSCLHIFIRLFKYIGWGIIAKPHSWCICGNDEISHWRRNKSISQRWQCHWNVCANENDNSKLYVMMIINGGMPLAYNVRICHWYGSCQYR